MTRFRKAAWSTAAFYVDRIARAGVAFVRVPLLLHALGVKEYGVALVLGSVLGLASLSESGLNAGVVNGVAEATSDGKEERVSAVVSTAFFLYAAIGLLLALLCLPAVRLVPIPGLLGLAPEYGRVARIWLALGVTGYCASLPVKAITSAVVGHQESYVVTFLGTLQEILGILGVYVSLVLLRVGLEGLALWQTLFPLAALSLSGLWILRWWRPGLRPRWRLFDRSVARRLLIVSGSFYWIQVAALVLWSVDNVVVSANLGAAAVPTYSVSFQMYFMAMQLATAFTSALWAGVSEAASKGDWAWVRRAYSHGLAVSIGIATTFAVLGACFGREALALWAGPEVFGGRSLLFLFSIWLVAQAWTSSHSILLGALSKLKTAVWVVSLEALLNLALSIVLVRRMGVAGVALGTLVGHLLVSAWLMPWDLARQTKGRLVIEHRPLLAALSAGALAIGAADVLRRVLGAPVGFGLLTLECFATVAVFASLYLAWCLPRAARNEAFAEIARRLRLMWAGRSAVAK